MVTLETSKPFRMLKGRESDDLGRIACERSYSAGEEIFKEGDNGDGIYVVKDGLVEISIHATQGSRKIFAQIGPGEMFGEMAVIELKPRSATATAAKPSVVYFIPRDELLAMIEQSPVLALEFLRQISQRLREFNQRHIQEILQAERLAVIGRFARSIVHDIKNPLHVISLTAEISGMEKATAESRKKAGITIRQQVERVSEMISEILDFTQGSRSEFVFATLDYATFIKQLVEELRPEVELKQVSLETKSIPNLRVALDPRRLRRVFFNLIHNATDAMPEGGKVFLRFSATETEVITEVEDTGSGIAAEMADKLFEVFATFGKAHGTGLGLSICKKIIEDHHGRIWARQEPGRGAIFCFALPRLQA